MPIYTDQNYQALSDIHVLAEAAEIRSDAGRFQEARSIAGEVIVESQRKITALQQAQNPIPDAPSALGSTFTNLLTGNP